MRGKELWRDIVTGAAWVTALLSLLLWASIPMDIYAPREMAFPGAWLALCSLLLADLSRRLNRKPDSGLTEEQAEVLKRFACNVITYEWLYAGDDPRGALRRIVSTSGLVRKMERDAAGEAAEYEGLVEWLI